MTFLFDNETDKNVDSDLIERVVAESLAYEGIKDDCEVSVSIVDNSTIQKLNKKHRGIDRPTDVLSFPLIDYTKEKLPGDGSKIYLGDIVISIEKAEEQAEEYGHSLERETGFLTAHSMLHLLGYDHMTETEEKEMFSKQNDILENLELRR